MSWWPKNGGPLSDRFSEQHSSGFWSPLTMVANFKNRLIGLVDRVFANGPRDLGSIPGRVIPKTLKMVLDTSLLNTQHYKVHNKGKIEQSREMNSAPPTSQFISYWKGRLLLALDHSCQLYFLIVQVGMTRLKSSVWPNIVGGRIYGFIPFPRVLEWCKKQTAWFRIWTLVITSISYDNNCYSTRGWYIQF